MTWSASSRFIGASLEVGTHQPFDILLIENSWPRMDRLQLRTQRVKQSPFNHTSGLGRLVAVLVENVPPAEHKVVKRGQWYEVLDQWRATVCTFAESDRSDLGEGAGGRGQALPDRVNACDKRRAHSTKADEQDAQASLRRCDFIRAFHDGRLYHVSF